MCLMKTLARRINSKSSSRKASRQAMLLLAICFVFSLICAPSSWAVDPDNRISQYAHAVWRIRDGFFNGTPNAIAQTTDGYIWIGTLTGLVRFDGVRFVPWSP